MVRASQIDNSTFHINVNSLFKHEYAASYLVGLVCDPIADSRSTKISFVSNITTEINYVTRNDYGKCSKILNTFLFRFTTKMLVIRDGVHNMLVSIANREDQEEAV